MVGSPLIQLPVFVTAVLAVRRLAQQPGIGLETGGALWFYDLTQTALNLDTVSAPMVGRRKCRGGGGGVCIREDVTWRTRVLER